MKRAVSLLMSLCVAASVFVFPADAQETLPAPRIYYSFDDSDYLTVENEAGEGYSANGYGSLEITDNAVSKNALCLKGGYVKLPENCVADTDELTISFWANSSSAVNNVHIFDIGTDARTFLNLSAYRGDKEYAADLRINADAEEITSGDKNTFVQNEWVHLAVTYAGNTLSVYKNGRLIQQKANMKHSVSELGITENAYIGLSLWSGDASFYGYIDEFKIYDSALDAGMIDSEYKAGLSGLTARIAAGLAKLTADKNHLAPENYEILNELTGDLSLPAKADLKNTFGCAFDISWVSTDREVISNDGKITRADQTKSAQLNAVITGIDGFEEVRVPLSVSVAPASKAVTADKLPEITTAPGTAPKLPEYISANGGNSALSVEWEEINPSDYAFAGNITVEGTASNGQTVSQPVKVDGSKFANPIINQLAADPYITYQDGWYYYVRSSDQGTGVMVAKSKRLQDIGSAPRVKVYSAPSSGMYSREWWAPEIHYLKDENGGYNWYIYVAADDGNNANHRMYVLRCTDPDNAQAPYEMVGKIGPTIKQGGEYVIDPEQDKWAIDGTVITAGDKYYFVWSGWEGYTDGRQDIYIAEMANPTTIAGPRTLISKPDTLWERKGIGTNSSTGAFEGLQVNEGPQQIINPSDPTQIYVTYSCGFSGSDWYSLGYVKADLNSDLLNPESWTKSGGPFFTQSLNPADSTYGTGHASFTVSPDQTEQWIIYHAFQRSGGGWENRSARAMKTEWKGDVPYIGVPVAEGVLMNAPSGTEDITAGKFEAENAELTSCRAARDTCASGQYYVTLGRNSEIKFTVNAPETGLYQLSFTGCHTTPGMGYQTLTVNGYSRRIRYMGSNVSASHYSTAYDAESETVGTGIYQNLYKGENTITLTYDPQAGGATQVDCLTMIYWGEAEPVSVESITCPEQLSMNTGTSAALNASVYPPRADEPGIIYSSSAPEIISVDENGVLTARRDGTAVITLKAKADESITASCTVTAATVILPESISIPASKSIKTGEKFSLGAVVSPPDTTDKSLLYTSSAPGVASVSQNGVVTGLKAGTAVITVRSAADESVTASCTVTVTAPASSNPKPGPEKQPDAVKTGLVKKGAYYYYIAKNGKTVKNAVRKINRKYYAFDKKGRRVKGTKIVKIGKYRYYVKNGRVVSKQGWYKVKNKWYHVGRKRRIDVKKLLKHRKKTVYVGAKGYKIKKGRIKIKKKTYKIKNYIARKVK